MAAAPPLPPASGRLLSDMGMRRGRTSGEQTFHAGMDLGHPGGRGTPVLAVQKGIVEHVLSDATRRRGAFNGYGNAVVVRHYDNTWGLYAHLDRALVRAGDHVDAGQRIGTMGNSSNGKFPGMGVHLHLELRRARPGGASPFPGPYRTYNLDPRPWLGSKGLVFSSRGAFEIRHGTPMEETRSVWQGLGAGPSDENLYEPPARFDRDVYFGLTPIEWGAVGAGALLTTGFVVAVLIRRRQVRANRLRRRRRRRLRG